MTERAQCPWCNRTVATENGRYTVHRTQQPQGPAECVGSEQPVRRG